eukprot:7307094-Prymnesium_polylepis.1
MEGRRGFHSRGSGRSVWIQFHAAREGLLVDEVRARRRLLDERIGLRRVPAAHQGEWVRSMPSCPACLVGVDASLTATSQLSDSRPSQRAAARHFRNPLPGCHIRVAHRGSRRPWNFSAMPDVWRLSSIAAGRGSGGWSRARACKSAPVAA